MGLELYEGGERDLSAYCYDDLANQDIAPEEWVGLAAADHSAASWHLFEYIANRLKPPRGKVTICMQDSGEHIALLIEEDEWSKPRIQKEWSEIIATPREKLIEYADVRDCMPVHEAAAEEWSNMQISERIERLLDRETKDISVAIHDDIPTEVIECLIDWQVECLLD